MLRLLTTDAFTEWFAALDDDSVEEVATALDVIEELGPAKAPPGSRESVLWFEHPRVSRFQPTDSFAWDPEAWGCFRDYARQILAKLDSPRFAARLSRLGPKEAALILECIREIRSATGPRIRWAVKSTGDPSGPARNVRPENACDVARRIYFTALEAAGFRVAEVPAHSLALREFSRRVPAPAFRLLYGVDVERKTALVVLGEFLDRSSYGDSVHRAERMWKQFLDGELRAAERAPLR